jgi:hypothetical protein
LPCLTNFGCIDYTVAREIQAYVEIRRNKFLDKNADTQGRNPQTSQVTTKSFSFDEDLPSALSELQVLQEQLQLAQASSRSLDDRALGAKERESLHRVILALWKLAGFGFESRDIVSAVERNLELLGLGLSNGTIRTRIKEAIETLRRR